MESALANESSKEDLRASTAVRKDENSSCGMRCTLKKVSDS